MLESISVVATVVGLLMVFGYVYATYQGTRRPARHK